MIQILPRSLLIVRIQGLTRGFSYDYLEKFSDIQLLSYLNRLQNKDRRGVCLSYYYIANGEIVESIGNTYHE